MVDPIYLSVFALEYSIQRLHTSESLHTTNDEMLPETNPPHLQIHRLLADPRIYLDELQLTYNFSPPHRRRSSSLPTLLS